MPSDLTGSPSFLLPYALAQDGIDAPADYNNRGQSAGQPVSVSIANLAAGNGGSLEPAGDGAFTAVISTAYPEGATMRAVALQGYYSQTVPVVGGGTVRGVAAPPHAAIAIGTGSHRFMRREP